MQQSQWFVGWLEFNVPFQHKYGHIRDETVPMAYWTKLWCTLVINGLATLVQLLGRQRFDSSVKLLAL